MTPLLLNLIAVAAVSAADLTAVARLPGEPSIVSAAGTSADEQSILTLENASALDPVTTKYRAVLFGGGVGGSAKTAAAVVEMVRWFKTDAPQALRDRWLLCALPSADALDEAAKRRWVTFQAPDIVIEVVDGDVRPTGTGGVDEADWVVRLPAVPGALGGPLGAAKLQHSPVRQRINARLTRDPLTLAKLLASRYPATPAISYIPSVAWANTLRLAEITGDTTLQARVEQQTAPWRLAGKDLFGSRVQLTSVAGTFVFAEIGAPDVFEKGVDAASKIKDAAYEYGQGWTDDMFMATVVLARAGKIDLASTMLIAYASRLQRADGVFVHAPNGPLAWGRGNAFAALGLMEALSSMRGGDPNRARVLEIYRRQMEAARKVQAPDGMWNEVLDEPGSYREESATAMLMTAMLRGIRAGWLDESYLAAVERAWRGVAAHVDEDGSIVDVCTSTGAGPTKRYYLDRTAVTGFDDRGGAMALMAAVEFSIRHEPLR
jgi:unsaturated rhamnogalacturonyl hydrolase